MKPPVTVRELLLAAGFGLAVLAVWVGFAYAVCWGVEREPLPATPPSGASQDAAAAAVEP